jgi:hypothetical protein
MACYTIAMTTRIKEDLTGYTSGRITVVQRVQRPPLLKQSGSYWLYRCECGAQSVAHRTTIIRSLKSCGCLAKQKKYAVKSTIYYRRLYHIWHSMLDRCRRSTNPDFKNYGGRGIKVSQQWNDFGAFYNDMIDSYEPGLTLERLDVDGNYCRENCCWITNQAQASNRRTSLSYRAQRDKEETKHQKRV